MLPTLTGCHWHLVSKASRGASPSKPASCEQLAGCAAVLAQTAFGAQAPSHLYACKQQWPRLHLRCLALCIPPFCSATCSLSVIFLGLLPPCTNPASAFSPYHLLALLCPHCGAASKAAPHIQRVPFSNPPHNMDDTVSTHPPTPASHLASASLFPALLLAWRSHHVPSGWLASCWKLYRLVHLGCFAIKES